MALDEGLLQHGNSTPVLRFYTWVPDTLSLGYFQRFEEVPQIARAGAVVRRTTGGGAIHHAEELTYSMALPGGHALVAGEVRGSYERIHSALAHAFASLGVEASLRGDAALRSDDAGSAMCFHVSTPLDLTWSGAKGVGSAQRRSGGRVLHHGSIKLGTTPLEGPVATLRAAAPGHAALSSPEALAEHLLPFLAESFGARFGSGEPTPLELEHAARRADFFGSEAHLRRR